MATKYVTPGKVSIQLLTRNNAKRVPKTLAELPGGLYPLRMALWDTDEYRISNGWPVSIPRLDVSARSLVSSSGEILAYRKDPLGTETNAAIRWVADDTFYNVTEGTWMPYQNQYSVAWEFGAEYAPTLIEDYEYRVNREVFHQTGINFDSDSKEHMQANLGSAVGGAAGYTVVMALVANSVYGNNEAIPYSGLWCPGRPAPGGGVNTFTEPPQGAWVSLTLQGTSLYLESDQSPRTRVLGISELTSTSAPVYIAMVVGRPYTVIYAGRSTASLTRVSMGIGSTEKSFDGNVVLGRTNGDVLHTADMTMLDLNFYTEKLAPTEVRDEVAMLAGVYGGDR